MKVTCIMPTNRLKRIIPVVKAFHRQTHADRNS